MKHQNNVCYSCQNNKFLAQYTTLIGDRIVKPIEITGKPFITWAIKRFPTKSKLSKEEVIELLGISFEIWLEAFNPIQFKLIENYDEAQIKISFEPTQHHESVGCPYDFDGESGVLAHAFPPHDSHLSLNIHFDDSERWSYRHNSETGEVDLPTVGAHELGHCWNGGHSQFVDALMYAAYTGEKRMLHKDDVDLVDALYAKEKQYWIERLKEQENEEENEEEESKEDKPSKENKNGIIALVLFLIIFFLMKSFGGQKAKSDDIKKLPLEKYVPKK